MSHRIIDLSNVTITKSNAMAELAGFEFENKYRYLQISSFNLMDNTLNRVENGNNSKVIGYMNCGIKWYVDVTIHDPVVLEEISLHKNEEFDNEIRVGDYMFSRLHVVHIISDTVRFTSRDCYYVDN